MAKLRFTWVTESVTYKIQLETKEHLHLRPLADVLRFTLYKRVRYPIILKQLIGSYHRLTLKRLNSSSLDEANFNSIHENIVVTFYKLHMIGKKDRANYFYNLYKLRNVIYKIIIK